MNIVIQLSGIKGAVPQNIPAYLVMGKNEVECRMMLCNYLEEHAVEVPSISQFSASLREDLARFYDTGIMDFKIYRCRDIFGFPCVDKQMTRYTVCLAYFQSIDVDTSRPWLIRPDPTPEDYRERFSYIITDKYNRVVL